MLRKEKSSLAEKAARTAFFLYIIFMLIGTAPPFQEDVDITRKSTSNPINQIVDSLIPFVSLLCLWPRRKTLLLLLKEEKYLSLFFAWCLFTILWSDFPLNSFKVCVRLFGSTMVILAVLLNLKSPDEALRYFKAVFAFYIPVSFLAIAFVPAATQWEWPAWRGLADHKNTLGQISFIAILVWAFAVCGTPVKKRIGSWLFLFASLILLFGSKSTTPLITLISLVLMGLCLIIDRRFGRLISSTVIVCSLFAVLLVNAFSLEELTGAFGKDTTFTQRDDIWAALIREAKIHPFIGCGLGGFWLPENPSVLRLSENDELGWQPAEGHEGYLDLLNETGIVGLVLLALMVISYFYTLSKLRKPNFWKWFVIGILIVNLTESTLFRSASLSGWLFVFSYLAVHVELIQSRTRVKQVLGWRLGTEPGVGYYERPAMA